jgi:glutaminyl-peptide cyclotransferase
MVLRGKLRGRVGSRRIKFHRKPAQSPRSFERAFAFAPQALRQSSALVLNDWLALLQAAAIKGMCSPTIKFFLLAMLLILSGGTDGLVIASATAAKPVPVYTYQVTHVYPHDPTAFTQGLIFKDGLLWESTGLNGRSTLRKVELETGRVLKKLDVPQQYFAEGLTVFRGRVYQLTWQAQKGFIYDPETFRPLGEFAYTGEGWGLTHDEQSLIMSDGTNRIRFLDPVTFAVKRTISVVDEGQPLNELNELEYVKGEIYANIWQTDRIVRVEPQTGKILGWIDLTGLLPAADRTATTDVLNGIAYDEASGRLFVTGKLWPKLFEIKLVKR